MSTDDASRGDLQPGDYLVDTSTESSGETHLRLLWCPICDKDLRGLSLQLVHKHIGEHSPGECGLTAEPGDYEYRPLADICLDHVDTEEVGK